jgi:hypothetical protein
MIHRTATDPRCMGVKVAGQLPHGDESVVAACGHALTSSRIIGDRKCLPVNCLIT